MEVPDVSALLAQSYMEFVMFSLAALIYVLFKGSWATSKPRPQPPPGQRVASPRVSKAPALATDITIAPSEPVRPDGEAHQLLLKLPADGVIDHEAAKRLLLALCRPASISEEVLCLVQNIAGRFESRALEAAASEASVKIPSADVCQRLYNIAGLVAIPKTERAVQLLARGHAHDRHSLRSFVEDVSLRSSGVSMTRNLAECLAAICSGAKEHDAAKLILERAEVAVNQKPVVNHATNFNNSHNVNTLSRQAKSISSFGRQGDLKAAIQVFDQLRKDGVTPTVLVYNCLLDACILCSDVASALGYFADMKAKGHLDAVSYNTVMKGLLTTNNVEAVKRLFAEMDPSGQRAVAPNRATYHSVLSALGQQSDRKAIWTFVAQMQANGFAADKVSCSIMLKSVRSPSQAADLRKIVEIIDVGDLTMDDFLFASLIEACVRTGSLDLIRGKMQHRGLSKLSASACGSMIKAFGQVGDIDRMWELWAEIPAREVTSVTLGCMVEALVNSGYNEDAWQLVHKLWEDEVTRPLVNTITYSTLMKGFAMSKKPDRIQMLYKEMLQRNLSVNTITYNTMLNALVRSDLTSQVPEILEHMKAANPPVLPDIITYSTIIKGYCNVGELDKSLALVEEMKTTSGLCPDEVMYNSLLDGCAKQQRLEEALHILDEMQRAKVAPSNYTLSIVIKLLGRAKRLDQAFALVELVCQEHNFRPNATTYTCLMQACFNNRQLQRGMALHEKMLRTGDCFPDEKTYCVMVRGCLQAGNVAKAVEVIRCAHHLPGHSMSVTSGQPAGVFEDILHEVIGKLGTSADAKDLVADLLSFRGITVTVRPYHEAGQYGGRVQARKHQPQGYRS